MRANLGINIASVLGVLLLITGLGQAGNLATEKGLMSFLLGSLILFGSLACKRAKLERNKTNLFFEFLYLLISFFPIIFTISKNNIVQHPIHYVVAPLWIVIAYGIIKYKK